MKQRPLFESVICRINSYEEFGEIMIKDDCIHKPIREKSIKKRRTDEPLSLIKFFNNMGLHLMDTYLVGIIAVMEICNLNCEVLEDNLVNELHKAIITMHSQTLIAQLHSCLKETI